MNTAEPPRPELEALARELAAIELPHDGLTDPEMISDAMDQIGASAIWRYTKQLFTMVAKARRLVGEPRRRTTEPRL